LYSRVAREKPDISEEHTASIFRVKEYAKREKNKEDVNITILQRRRAYCSHGIAYR
jgi:hypothetical protein